MSRILETPSSELEKTLSSQPKGGDGTARIMSAPLETLDEGYEMYAMNMDEKGEVNRTPEMQAEWEAKSRAIGKKFDRRLLAMMCFLVGGCCQARA